MKAGDTDIDRMVMESHYLDALEIESYAQEALSEMERREFIAMIESLKETIGQMKEMISDLRAMNQSLEAKVESARKSIEEKDRLIEELTRKLSASIEQNRRHRRERYHKTSMKGRNDKPGTGKSREEEKDDYDGPDNGNASSSDVVDESSLDQTKVRSEFLGGSRGPRGTYNTMMAAYIE